MKFQKIIVNKIPSGGEGVYSQLKAYLRVVPYIIENHFNLPHKVAPLKCYYFYYTRA